MEKKQRKGITFYVTTMVILFLLMVGSIGVATWAVIKSRLEIGGNISFKSAGKVYATVSAGTIEGGTIEESDKLTAFDFDANTDTPDMTSWKNFNLKFNDAGDDVTLNFSITNNSTEQSLLVTTETVTADTFNNATCQVKVNGKNDKTYTIASNATANYSVVFKVTNKNYDASITNFVIPFTLENVEPTTPTTPTYEQVFYQGSMKNFISDEVRNIEIVGTKIFEDSVNLLAESDSALTNPEPPPIVVVDDIKFDEFISEHMNDALNFVEVFVRPVLVDEGSEVKSEIWYMEPNVDENKIQEVGIIYTVQENENLIVMKYAKMIFDTEHLIVINDIVDGTVESLNSNYYTKSVAYQMSYNPNIQSEHEDLTNSLCDKLFGINSSSIRFIVDQGEMIDSQLGNVKSFKVIEIVDSVIREQTVKIAL